MKWHHVLLAACVVMVSLSGQACVKAGLNQVRELAAAAGGAKAGLWQLAWHALANKWFVLGFFVMGVGALLYCLLLYSTDFTRALPVMGAIAYLIIPVYGYFALKEPLSLAQCAGLCLLVAGIVLLRR